MDNEIKFFRCEHCGNIIAFLHDSGVKVQCCGDDMGLITAQTADSAGEKHVPVVTMDGNKVTVTVGSVPHPMEEKHYIEFVALLTENGVQVAYLEPGEKPVAEFSLLAGDKVLETYEYCNIHSLWKA